MDAEGLVDELGNFADDVGLSYEEVGAPRVWGRVLGWLLVCQPDVQSAEDLATALHASKGSISMATQALIRSGMVERQTLRRDRRTYYRIRPGAWTSVFEDQTRIATMLRELAERGLALLNGEPAERRLRLEELHDLMAFYEHEAPALLARWREHRQSTAGESR
jgi:DNA-binding transcriptional regulator GbsR (MarR family)